MRALKTRIDTLGESIKSEKDLQLKEKKLCAELADMRISPYRTSLVTSPSKQSPIQSAETYYRSEDSPITKVIREKHKWQGIKYIEKKPTPHFKRLAKNKKAYLFLADGDDYFIAFCGKNGKYSKVKIDPSIAKPNAKFISLVLQYKKNLDTKKKGVFINDVAITNLANQIVKNHRGIVVKVEKPFDRYEDNKFTYGDRAHAGAYSNILQLFGGAEEPTKNKLKTTLGDAHLYDKNLYYRQGICRYIVEQCKKLLGDASNITVGYYNEYPCIMVNVNKKTICKSDNTKKVRLASFEAWVELLLSFYVSLVNKIAFDKNIPIELSRRSSFGFYTPTVSRTGESFRINLGIIPRIYADILVTALQQLNSALSELKKLDLKKFAALPKDCFYGSKNHVGYLEGKYKIQNIDNVIHLLWLVAEKAGKTTAQNITRSAEARQFLSASIFKELLKKDVTPVMSFINGISTLISQVTVVGKKLSTKITGTIEYGCVFREENSTCKRDRRFWDMIKAISKEFIDSDDSNVNEAAVCLVKLIKTKNIYYLFNVVELLQQALFLQASSLSASVDIGDGFGSDSSEEAEIFVNKPKIELGKNKKEVIAHQTISIFAKKVVTHNGMRAIWAAITATANVLKDSCLVYLDKAYYEVAMGIKLIKKLDYLRSVTKVDTPADSNVIVYDLNACITTGTANHDYTIGTNKILILDATSATPEQVHKHIKRFLESRAKILFVVDSGFKNQQLGSDKNPYGTLRVFARDKSIREKIIASIKEKEPKLLSPIAHSHRRLLKKHGAVPVTKFFLQPKVQTEERARMKSSETGMKFKGC